MANKNKTPTSQLSDEMIDYLYSVRPDVQMSQQRYGTGTGTVSRWWEKSAPEERNKYTQMYSAYVAKKAAEPGERRTQVMGAYDAAKAKYAEMLTGLKPRYEALEAQLAKEKEVELGKEAQLVGTEQTQLKGNIAARGLEANVGNEFYQQEMGKLGATQDLRRRGIEAQYGGRALEIAGARSQDERDITAALAGLDVDAANALNSMFENDRTFEENKEQFKRQYGLDERQYQLAVRQFNLNKRYQGVR
jgi:hypothetical protein